MFLVSVIVPAVFASVQTVFLVSVIVKVVLVPALFVSAVLAVLLVSVVSNDGFGSASCCTDTVGVGSVVGVDVGFSGAGAGCVLGVSFCAGGVGVDGDGAGGVLLVGVSGAFTGDPNKQHTL